jgi:hypothetical protein
MKQLQVIPPLVVALAVACLALAAPASATTLEVKGVKQSSATTIDFSLVSGTSVVIRDTSQISSSTCTSSTLQVSTTTPTGGSASGPDSSWIISSCTGDAPTVDAKGSLSITNISGTTNGTVRMIGAKVTVPSPFGLLTCMTPTGEGADIGTLTGVSSGKGTLHTQAVMNCGATWLDWEGDFYETTPEGLGVAT